MDDNVELKVAEGSAGNCGDDGVWFVWFIIHITEGGGTREIHVL